MNVFDVMSYKQNPKDKREILVCGQLIDGNRFRVKRIEVKNTDVSVEFSNGIVVKKPELIESLHEFTNLRDAQSFLLKGEVRNSQSREYREQA